MVGAFAHEETPILGVLCTSNDQPPEQKALLRLSLLNFLIGQG